MGFYNFSLFWELLLIPIVSFISILFLFAEQGGDDRNSKIVSYILGSLLSILGFGILTFSILKLVMNYTEFFTLSNLKSFLLPPMFTIMFMPLIYYTVLYVKYEKVFGNLKRYKFLSDSRRSKIRLYILRYANINLNYIDNANKIILFNKSDLQNTIDIRTYLRKSIQTKNIK